MANAPLMSSLRAKFLVPLLLVAFIALSAALILRSYVIADFRQFLEGGAEDHAQMIINDLEGQYEHNYGLSQEDIKASMVRALMLGIEVKYYDQNDHEMMNSRQAVSSLSPLMKKRVLANVGETFGDPSGSFTPYPLFFNGNEIGHLEIRHLAIIDEALFIKKSNRYLLYISLSLGSLAMLLGIILSRRLIMPLQRLMLATRAVKSGDYAKRVPITGKDEIAQLAECFNSMADTLQTQEALRKKLLGNAAHELRTPLMVIRGELEGMIDGILPSDKERLASLHEEAGRLCAILEGMDDLTRAEASGLNLHRQRIVLAQYLINLKDRFVKMASDKGVAFNLECNETTFADADPDILSQILINLFSNALKATSVGGEIIMAAENDKALSIITVTDNGKGIAEKDLPFIFERFYRVEKTGLGLGLAIVKELVHAHGGTIAVASNEGKGTTFTVAMPLSLAPLCAGTGFQIDTASSISEQQRQQGFSVLTDKLMGDNKGKKGT